MLLLLLLSCPWHHAEFFYPKSQKRQKLNKRHLLCNSIFFYFLELINKKIKLGCMNEQIQEENDQPFPIYIYVNRIIISLYFSQQQQRRRSKSFSVDFPFPSCVLFPSPAHRREHFAAQSTTTPALSLLLLYKSPPFILFPLFLPHPPISFYMYSDGHYRVREERAVGCQSEIAAIIWSVPVPSRNVAP